MADTPRTKWLTGEGRCDDCKWPVSQHPVDTKCADALAKAATIQAEREPPARRIYVPANLDLRTRVSDTDIEYLEAAPILAALERVEIIHEGMAVDRTAQIVIRKSDWEVLVNAINGQ